MENPEDKKEAWGVSACSSSNGSGKPVSPMSLAKKTDTLHDILEYCIFEWVYGIPWLDPLKHPVKDYKTFYMKQKYRSDTYQARLALVSVRGIVTISTYLGKLLWFACLHG